MEGVITFFIFIIVIIIGICVMNKAGITQDHAMEIIDKDPDKKVVQTDHSTLVIKENVAEVNGVKIHLSDEEIEKIKQKEKEKAIRQFNKEKKELLDYIKSDIEYCDDIIKKKVLKELLNHPLETQADYERLKYIYNYGQLRSNEEVKHYDRYVNTKEQRENYDNERHRVNLLAFVIPFISVFIIVYAATGFPLFGVPLGFIIGGFAGYIGMIIGYNINISKAKEYCISDTDPSVIDEKRKRAVGIAAGIAAGTSIGKHAKKNTKELLNPDSWNKNK